MNENDDNLIIITWLQSIKTIESIFFVAVQIQVSKLFIFLVEIKEYLSRLLFWTFVL